MTWMLWVFWLLVVVALVVYAFVLDAECEARESGKWLDDKMGRK